MAATMAQKRKPFGAIDGNVRVAEKRSAASSAAVDVRKSKSKSSSAAVSSSLSSQSNTLKQGIRGTNSTNQQFDSKTTEQRRDSKTPKTSNLSATGGAYGFENTRDICKPRGRGKPEPPKDAAQHGLDPSPLKLPDPIATSSSNNKSLRLTIQRQQHSKSTKARDGESDSTDGFVSASLKRLFPSKTSSKHEQTIKSSRLASAKVAPYVNNSSRNMDPIAKGEVEDEARGVDADEVLDTMQGMFRMNEQQNRTNHPHEVADVQLPMTGRTQPIIPPQRHEKPSGGLDELLDRARKGPTDNKRVLDAMLTSGCGRRTLGPDPTVNESSMESIVGTIIGGTSLKRSTSIDESEVTTMDYTMDSSHASMTTCFDQGLSGRGGVVAPHHTASDNLHSIAGKQIRGAILRSAVPPPSPAKSQVMSWYHEMQRASATTDTRPTTEQNHTGAMSSIFRTAVPPPPTSQVMPSYQENHRTSSITDIRQQTEPIFRTAVPPPSSSQAMSSYQEMQRASAITDTRPSSDQNQMGAMPSILRPAVPPPPSSSQAMPSYQELYRASAIANSRPPTEQNHTVVQPQLPAGWKVRWSNTKQKPYWVHPDFGSTWHCPGVIVNGGSEFRRNKVFNAEMRFETINHPTASYVPSGNMAQSTVPGERDNTNMRHNNNDHISKFTQEDPNTSSSGTNYESESYNIGARQSHVAYPEQMSEWNGADNTMDNSKFDQNPDDYDRANTAKCLDGSSADVSSRCLTQEFETKRDGSTDNGAEAVVDNGNNDAVEHGHDYASLGEVNGEENDVGVGNTDYGDIGENIFDTVADEQSDLINAVVKHSRKYASPLSTINETHRGSACQSSEVSLDDDSSINDDPDRSKQTFSPIPSFDGPDVSGSDDSSAPDDAGNIGVDNTAKSPVNWDSNQGGYDSDDDAGNIGIDNTAKSPDNWESSNQGGFDSDDYDLDAEPKEKRKASSRRGPRKKKSFFPPGPLCSLQFLEEIENDEFNTPLWRRMKRKRSTLASVKAQKQRQKQRQKLRRATLS